MQNLVGWLERLMSSFAMPDTKSVRGLLHGAEGRLFNGKSALRFRAFNLNSVLGTFLMGKCF